MYKINILVLTLGLILHVSTTAADVRQSQGAATASINYSFKELEDKVDAFVSSAPHFNDSEYRQKRLTIYNQINTSLRVGKITQAQQEKLKKMLGDY